MRERANTYAKDWMYIYMRERRRLVRELALFLRVFVRYRRSDVSLPLLFLFAWLSSTFFFSFVRVFRVFLRRGKLIASLAMRHERENHACTILVFFSIDEK